MISRGNGWFELEGEGFVCLFDSIGLEIRIGLRAGSLSIGDLAPSPLPGLPRPSSRTVQAVVTTCCNLSCTYCSVSGNPCVRGGRGAMSSRTIDSVVGAAEGCSLFAVTGGEPLLERESVLEMFERISAPSVLFTNGTLMDTGTAAALRRTNTSVLVSLDGDSFRHDSLRRYPDGRGSWRNAVEGIRISKAEGLQVGISMVLREHNVEGLGETLSILYEEFRPASFGLNLLHYTGYGFDGPSPESYAGAMREAWRFARRTGSYVDQVARRLLPVVTGIPRYRDCEAMGGKAVYFPDGSRSCCVNWLGRSDPEPFWSERVPLRSPECSGCAALCICGGGCAWDGENLGGPGRMDARNCAWTMALLEEILLDVGLTFRGRTPSREELSKEYSPLLPDRSRVLGTSMGHME